MISQHTKFSVLALLAGAFPMSAQCFTAYVPVEEPSAFDGFGDLAWPSSGFWPDEAAGPHAG